MPSGAPADADAGARAGRAGTARPGPAADDHTAPAPDAPGSSGAAPETRSLALDGASGVVPLARDFTRQALYDWGWLPAATAERRAAAEDVLLVVSGWSPTPACMPRAPRSCGSSAAAACCGWRSRTTGPASRRPHPHRAGRPGGHGMFIVQRLCLDWGVIRATDAPGKTVWAELAAPA